MSLGRKRKYLWGIGVEEEQVSWWSVILDGDKVDRRQILEWTDHSVRDFLSKVGCKRRGPVLSFSVKDELPPIKQG